MFFSGMAEKLVEIVGVFSPDSFIGARLELKGPFSRAAIDDVIFNFRPCPYTAACEYQPGKGQATFPVRNEEEAKGFVDLLNKDLVRYGFVIRYSMG